MAGPSVRKIINWINSQEYNKTQLQTVTWPQLETMAKNRSIDPNTIKQYYRTIGNSVWSDWRQRRIKDKRVEIATATGLPTKYVGQERHPLDPNIMLSLYIVAVDLEIER